MVADGYKDTEIGVIPVEWEVKQLGDICDVKGGKRLPKGSSLIDIKTPYPYIRVRDMFMGGIDTNDILYVPENIQPKIKNYIISKNDLFISVAGTLGIVGEIPDELDNANLTENANKLTNIKADKKYLLYVLTSSSIQNIITSQTTVNAQPKLALGRIKTFTIPLPPLKEQEKIADILSTADDKINAIVTQIEKAETLKNGLLQKLLSEGIGHSEFKDSELGKIPESWEVIEFGKHLDVKSGFGFKAAEYSESGIPLIKIDNVSYGNIIWENTTYLPTHFTDDYKDLVLVKDDILLALNRPITQNKLKMAMLKEEDAPSILYQRVGKILFNKSYHYKFVYFMLYHYVYDFVIHHSVGTDQPFINISKIRKLLIPLPPLDEQKQITDILSTADEKLEMLRAKKGKYETLKKGLLQKLLSGEVRV